MHRIIILLIVSLLSTFSSFSQHYKSVLLPIEGTFPVVTNILEYEDFFVLPININNSDGGISITNVFIDQELNIANQLYLDGFSYNPEGPILIQDSLYIFGNTNEAFHLVSYIKTDLDLTDVDFANYVTSSANNLAVDATISNNYIYGLSFDEVGINRQMNLKKINIDSDEEVWSKDYFPNEQFTNGWDIITLQDSNLLISAHSLQDSKNLGSLYKLNQNGEVIWTLRDPDPMKSGAIAYNVIELQNSDLITCSNHMIEGDQQYLDSLWSFVPPKIACYDNQGVMKWDTVLNAHFQEPINSFKLEKGLDNHFYGTGQQNVVENDLFYVAGFVFKMDNNGNLLWRRRFVHNEVPEIQSNHLIQRVLELSNGDIIVAGRIVNQDGNHIWMMRLNEYGCLEQDEDCGEELIVTKTSELNTSESFENFKLYPNPIINGQLNLDFKLKLNGHIRIFNINGERIKSIEFNNQKLQIDINELNDGTYFIWLYDNDSKISTQKKFTVLKN